VRRSALSVRGNSSQGWSMTDTAAGCIGDDPACPCQDGDACHYRDILGSPGMPKKSAETLRRTVDDVLRHQLVIQAGRTRYHGQAPRDDELMVEEITLLRERSSRMEEALRRIAQWSEAYPLPVFPEPDDAYYAKAHEVLRDNGMALDRLSAAAMRHVITQVGKIAKDSLPQEAPSG
jgi:hypothetical protein